MVVKHYNVVASSFKVEDIFYIITTVFYYIVIHYVFIQQPPFMGVLKNTSICGQVRHISSCSSELLSWLT